MTNEEQSKPETYVTLGGKDYILAFDFKFLHKIQLICKKASYDVNPFSPSFIANIGPVELHAVAWALLSNSEPKKNPLLLHDPAMAIVGNMDTEDMLVFAEAIGLAYMASSMVSKKKEKKTVEVSEEEKPEEQPENEASS